MRRHHLKAVVQAAVVGVIASGLATAQDPAADAEQSDSAPAQSQPAGQLIEGLVLNYLGGGIAGALVRVEALDANTEEPPLAEGETGKHGNISITLPRKVDGNVRVRIRAEGYEEFVQEVDPTDPDNPPFVEAALEGAAGITGIVRAMSTGRPVQGARIEADSGGRDLYAETDGEGRYTLKGAVRGRARLKIAADGFATRRVSLEIDDKKVEQDIDLAAELPVELIVVTSEGDPADKVMIEGWIEPGRNYVETITDAKGRAALRGVSEDVTEIRLRLNGDGYVKMAGFDEQLDTTQSRPESDTRPAGVRPIRHRIVVDIAARIKGKITDPAGDPVIGVRVAAGARRQSGLPVTWTDQDGAYELDGLAAGSAVITFQHPDYAADVRELQLNAGKAANLDLKLDPGGKIAGTVTGTDDKPIDQAWVVFEEWKGHQTIGIRASTDKDGKFSLEHMPPGEITFTIVKAGFGSEKREVMTAGKTDYRIILEQSSAPAGGSRAPATEVKIPVGQTVPDFTMTGIDGTSYKLSDLKGKYVFLDFWASWCPPCQKEIPNIRALHEAMKKRADFVLVGVSLDTEEKDFKECVARKQMDWPQVWGPGSGGEEAFEMLDGLGIPYTCLIGPDGRILAQHIFGPKTVEEVKKLVKE